MPEAHCVARDRPPQHAGGADDEQAHQRMAISELSPTMKR
jgi:hypothetical protein